MKKFAKLLALTMLSATWGLKMTETEKDHAQQSQKQKSKLAAKSLQSITGEIQSIGYSSSSIQSYIS